MNIPFDEGVMVAWQALGGIGIGSGSLISGFVGLVTWLVTGGEFVIWTEGRLGWNMGLRRVTILVASGLESSAAPFFLFFFLFFLDFPEACGNSATIIGLGAGSGTEMYNDYLYFYKLHLLFNKF